MAVTGTGFGMDVDDTEAPIQFVEGLEAPPRRDCGPWDELPSGTHQCRKCGRLDPLDFILDD